MAASRLDWRLLLVAVPLLLLGCAGPRVRADYEAFRARKVELTRAPQGADVAGSSPYQLGVRLGPGFLDKATDALFSEELLSSNVIGQVDGGDASRGGRMFERFSGGGDASMKPQLKASGIKVGFPAQCPGCIKLQFQLEGGLSAPELRQVRLSGSLAVRARVSGAQVDGKPAIQFALEDVEQLRLELPIALPGPFNLLVNRVEEGVRQKISAFLQEHPEKSGKVIPLGEKFKLGNGIVLDGLGVETAPSPGGELFLGLNTTLAARPSVIFNPASGGLQQADWGIVVGEEVVSALLLAAVQSGKVATVYNTKGKADPEGKVALGLQRIRFTKEGFALDARIWYLGWPAFWRDYTLEGSLTFQDGKLQPKLTRMVAGQGAGAAWLSRLAESRMNPDKLTNGMGKTMPEDLSIPLGKNSKARLLPVTLQTQPGALLVLGELRVQKGASSAPAP